MNPPTVVAEFGGNHRGEFVTALRMIEIVARYCTEHFRLDGSRPSVAVKFQKRTPHHHPDDFQRPHPHPFHAYGPTYGAHREALEFNAGQHTELKAYCEEMGVIYSTSVWDLQAAQDIIRLDPEWIKVPSACNLDLKLLGLLATEYSGDLHVSLGMTTRAEVEQIVRFLYGISHEVLQRTVLYACTSGYPVPFEDVRLEEIGWLEDRFGHRIRGIGFSGHHHGYDVDMAAAAMGVDFIERHFTLDRTWKGTDHSASLEPDGLRKLIRGVAAVSTAMGVKDDGILPIEVPQRQKLKEVA